MPKTTQGLCHAGATAGVVGCWILLECQLECVGCILVVVFLDTALSLLGWFFHRRFRTYQRRHRRPRTRQLHRVKRTGGTTMAVVNLWLARDTLDANIGECCLDLECCFFFQNPREPLLQQAEFSRKSKKRLLLNIFHLQSQDVPRLNIHNKFVLFVAFIGGTVVVSLDRYFQKKGHAFSLYVF